MSLDALSALLSAGDREFIARIAARALRLPQATATHSDPPHIPPPEAVRDQLSRVVASWIPHPFTSQETRAARFDCLRYLIIAWQIEKVKRDIHPRLLPDDIVAQLDFARQNYRIRYFRIFRVNDLPTEIITNILRFAVWDAINRPVEAQLRVTWTCRRWREIALADAALWSVIWFRGSRNRIDQAWAWFERARQSPLDVRIGGDPSAHSDDESEVDSDNITAAAMGDILVRLFTRLSTIRLLIIVVDNWKSALTVLDLLASNNPAGVPLLQRFELHRCGPRNEDRSTLAWPGIISQPFLGGAVAPSLNHLSLNGVSIDWSGSVLRNLTSFDIRRLPASHSADASRFREILDNCPRLQKLCMDGASPVFEEQSLTDIVPVHLPYLRMLVVADFSRQSVTSLFSQFSAPNVDDLTLLNLCGDDYLPVLIKITSAFPKVRLLTAYSLQFDVSPTGCDSMRRWLESMPLLTYLRIANVANMFFASFLQPHVATPVIAPRLAFVDCQLVEPSILVQWAKDRHRLGAPLSKIYVSEELEARFRKEQISIPTTLCPLIKLPRGVTTPEEENLAL
ncbi:hypothetical protein DFH06DRAFT_1024979 [Mycena polygramma]|nr:hypothetical protein DFH06DRAFT_1024979 [Mycena polygramma]